MMNKITTILEAQPDGTLHLPLPPELRNGKVEVTATLRAAGDAVTAPAPLSRATPEMVRRRREAFQKLREMGGLRELIPDPVRWQRELRTDRSLPGRD
jgi:hypothetical protein